MTQCTQTVYKRDVYRRTGRGPSGFEMHYSREQCARQAVGKEGKCWQHSVAGKKKASDRAAWRLRTGNGRYPD